MSDIVGSAGTPAAVGKALKRAGWVEVEGSAALWKRDGATPIAWEDALLVLAEMPPVPTSTVKPGWKTTELWATAAVVVPALITGVETLQGNMASVPPEYRAHLGTALLVVSALLSGFYAQLRARAKASA